jgi:hypothetical protein
MIPLDAETCFFAEPERIDAAIDDARAGWAVEQAALL